MKQLLFALFTLISFAVNAQKQPVKPTPGLSGVGIFKIGAQYEDLMPQLVQERHAVIREYASVVDISSATEYRVIVDVRPDTIKEYRSEYALFGKDVRVFLVSSAIISDITVNNIYLTFYKNRLVRFFAEDGQQLQEAFADKYGPGTVAQSSKTVFCEYKLTGRKAPNIEFTKTHTWVNGAVKALAYYGNRYNQQCQDVTTYTFSVTDTGQYAAAVAASKPAAAAFDAKRAAKPKSKDL